MLGPQMPLARLGSGLGVLAALAIAVVAYPRPAETSVSRAYAALEHSPVPVEVVGWLQPAEASARLVADGYVLTERSEAFGELTLTGNRDAALLPPGAMTWQESGAAYSLQTTADAALLRSRIVSLDIARQQLNGSGIDIPLLYVVYLPASVLAIGWLTWSLLRRP
jgi:hypothetical protein